VRDVLEFMSHKQMSHVTHANESCHICGSVMSHMYMHIYKHIFTHMYANIYIYIHMNIYTNVYCIYIYIHIYIYMYIYMCMSHVTHADASCDTCE